MNGHRRSTIAVTHYILSHDYEKFDFQETPLHICVSIAIHLSLNLSAGMIDSSLLMEVSALVLRAPLGNLNFLYL